MSFFVAVASPGWVAPAADKPPIEIEIDKTTKHPPAINTAICEYHGIYAADGAGDAAYATFARSLTGPTGSKGLNIKNQVERHQVGGASVVIIQGGAITQHHGYGCRDRKAGIKTTAITQYEAASMSKFVTGITMVVADGRGDVDLGESATSLIGRFPASRLANWSVRQSIQADDLDLIDLRRVLNHAAGLDTRNVGLWKYGLIAPTLPTMRDLFLGAPKGTFEDYFLNGLEVVGTPQTLWSYSSGGYSVAEHILEISQPLAFKDYVQQHVFDAAGLTHITFDKGSLEMTDLVRGCSRDTCTYQFLQTNLKAGGGLIASARDFAELVTTVFNGGVTAGGRRLMTQAQVNSLILPAHHSRSTLAPCSTPGKTKKPATVAGGSPVEGALAETCVNGKFRELLDAAGLWYGLGVSLSGAILADGFPKFVSHTGSFEGTRTWFKINRETGDGVVVMINGVGTWTDGFEVTFGAEILRSEIQAAYNNTSW